MFRYVLHLLVLIVLISGDAAPAFANSLTLAWDPATDGTTVGYILWYGTASGVYSSRIDVGNVTTRRVEGLQDGTTYYFAVQAYNAHGEVSELSAEVSGRTSGVAPLPNPAPPSSPAPAPAPAPPSPTPSQPPTAPPSSSPSRPGGGPPAGGPPGNPPPAAEGRPQGPATTLVANMRDGRFIDISWLATGASSYRVEVGTAPGRTMASAVTSNTWLAFDTSELPATRYHVRVRPLVGGVPGPASEEDVVQASGGVVGDVRPRAFAHSCGAAPGTPRAFSAAATGNTAYLYWQPGGVEPTTQYLLQVGSAPGLLNLMTVPLPGGQTGLSAVAADGVYALRLIALNECGESTWGAETLLTIGTPGASGVAPGVVPSVTHQVDGSTVHVSWTSPGGHVTRYLIEAMTPFGPVSIDTGNGSTAFSHSNTPPGDYVVTVRAGNAAGFGPPSAPITITVR